MDKSAYIAMSGARATLFAQTAVANNLANAQTAGFKQAITNTLSVPINGNGYHSRINAMQADVGFDDSAGADVATGNPLDIALRHEIWLAVQSPDGSEAYTRSGNLIPTPNGQLLAGGHPVMEENGGALVVPPYQSLQIAADGTLSYIPLGGTASDLTILGRLRLVQAKQKQLRRDADGLMRSATPQTNLEPVDDDVLTTGAYETSNVNPAQNLVEMIQLQRAFELQINLIKKGDENAQSANTLIRLNGS